MSNASPFADNVLRVFLVAGEASGDLIGAHLMRSMKAQSTQTIQFYGVGGPKMTAEGLDSIFPYYELSMLGAVEVLPYVFNIAVRLRHTVDEAISKQPHIVVTIDSPGFCFRVVERLREAKLNAKFVHYVAPTVWVYKPERAEFCAKLFDHMLVLLPFEPPYFEKAGLACTWVGHPVVAETKTGDGNAFREKYQLADDVLLLTILPGSRKGEIERHMPIFAQAITMLAAQFPNLAIAATVPANVLPFIAPYFKNCPFRAIVTANEEDKRNAIAASNFAIVKSGTVALEVAMAGVPMVVTYKVHPLSAWYLRRKILIKSANLVNILEGKEIIPELLQELCNPLMIATACTELLSDPARQADQKQAEKNALDKLLLPDGERPSDKAAHVILQFA